MIKNNILVIIVGEKASIIKDNLKMN